MQLIIVPSYIEVKCTVTDASQLSNEFIVAFKQLTKEQKKRLKRLLASLASIDVLRSILSTNIVFLDNILLSGNKLTDSFTCAIVRDVLDSSPYFNTILNSFLHYLNVNTTTVNLLQNNLVELGKYQAEIDYGTGRWQEKQKEEDLLEEFGAYINFIDDEPPSSIVEATIDKIPKQVLLIENKKVFEIFKLCRYWVEETNLPNINVILALCEEFKIKPSIILASLPILYNSYYLNKPKENSE